MANLKPSTNLYSVLLLIHLTVASHFTPQLAWSAISCEKLFEPKGDSLRGEVTRKIARLFTSQIGLEIRGSLIEDGSQKNFEEIVSSDPSQGPKKLDTLKYLGFKVEKMEQEIFGHSEVGWVDVPEWDVFYQRYILRMNQLGIKPESMIRPALVFELPNRRNGATYRLVDPFHEKIPAAEEGWQLLKASTLFNLPTEVIIASVRRGLWPLMEAHHDVSHFVAFLNHPEFGVTVRKMISKTPDSHIDEGYKRRLFWVLEAFSYPDPQFRPRILRFTDKIKLTGKSLEEIRRILSTYDTVTLSRLASDVSAFFTSVLADVSGGTASTTEKRLYLKRDFQLQSPKDIFEQRASLDQLRRALDVYLRQAELHAPESYDLYQDIRLFNFSSKAFVLRATIRHLKENPSLESDVRELTSRLIYILNRSRQDIGLKELVEGLLDSSLSTDSPIKKFLEEIYPNESFQDLYLSK